ncbi:BRO1-domain-containing protein [Gloeophyllum trabeum ATCC 11539]|uniref:BRO1-domain-containing protein n=1 Tax=Gloeophyllum trabeum (strain ATCC 11539 / FP-39264 / Madison 617) TaxID=670483 RepID=S7Q225_GLOTA|nr:BRO1-domain-containing protein [Gloeophyllum trabeum ATCC 11539]EPQ54076.1 BRO1-domain-containing protein [Gloeophyllum trabeum ATCC 11539]
MSNQLSIPFKKTYNVPLKQAARDYIYSRHTDTHPDAFKWDLNEWDTSRKEGVGGIVRVDRIDPAVRYHAQLVFILTKLPVDIGLEIPYAPAFSPSSLPITLKNLAYERAAVVFNLGALYSQLASSEDRSNAEGIKRALAHYQNAAGTFAFLASSAVPPLRNTLREEEQLPLDLTEAFVKSLESLMLAQAQECTWQRAKLDNYKNGVIAKLAAKVAYFYEEAVTAIREASPAIKHAFPSTWIPHCEAKRYHFEAVAQYRKSVDDLEVSRYGHELSRLNQASMLAKKGYDIARRAGIAPAVVQDVKSLLDEVQKNIARAERDNDLIYHQDVPAPSALPVIAGAALVGSNTPTGLLQPSTVIGDGGVIFGELLAWGAREAVDIYQNRKEETLKDGVFDRAQELDDKARETLRTLNLPAALEALEKPVGLPPSLLKKSEEVRLADGPAWIETSVEAVKRLAARNTEVLNEALDILDQEAEEDEDFQRDNPSIRPPSHEANKDLISKADRYRAILSQAVESDEVVRRKWDDWERNIIELTWDKEDLEASIPSSTGRAATSNQTQANARALRVLLENLDDVIRTRSQLVERARRLAEADDIKPRILKVAGNIAQWKEVTPAMFENDFDEELAKYEKFRQGIDDAEKQQQELLTAIKARNDSFLQSRREDPNVKEREHALQSLDLAYHKYREIRRNLEEGIQFYNDLAGMLAEFRESCKEWARRRRHEARSIVQSMSSLSIGAPSPEQRDDHVTTNSEISPLPSHDAHPPLSPVPSRKGPAAPFNLPPPDSGDWEEMDLPPGPPVPSTPRTRRGGKRNK